MVQVEIGTRINTMMTRTPKITERELASQTGMPQSTIHAVRSGQRTPKLNELLALANAFGCTVGELTGDSQVAARLICSIQTTNDEAMENMRAELTHYFELDSFLADQGF